MVIVFVLLVLIALAAVAGYTGRGVTDSRDPSFSLHWHPRQHRTSRPV